MSVFNLQPRVGFNPPIQINQFRRIKVPKGIVLSQKPYVYFPGNSCTGCISCKWVGNNTNCTFRAPPPNCCGDCARPF